MTTVNQALLVACRSRLPGAIPSYYTAPANTTAKIGRAVFCNTTGGALTITAAISAGVAIAAGNTLISARNIAAGESYVSPELAGQVIPAGSTLRAFASAGASVTLMVSGITIQ